MRHEGTVEGPGRRRVEAAGNIADFRRRSAMRSYGGQGGLPACRSLGEGGRISSSAEATEDRADCGFNRKEPSAASRNRFRNCPQITRINADMKKTNSPSASICVICGQMPFLLLPLFIAFRGRRSLQIGVPGHNTPHIVVGGCGGLGRLNPNSESGWFNSPGCGLPRRAFCAFLRQISASAFL